MKILVILLLSAFVLAGCGKTNTTTMPFTTTLTELPLESDHFLFVGDEYDFDFLDYSLSNDVLSVENGILKAVKTGLCVIKIQENNKNYILNVEARPDDLYEFEHFVRSQAKSNNFSFKVYSGTSSYVYNRIFDDLYLFYEELEIETSYIKMNTKSRPGTKREVNWIVIHDTGNISSSADALNHQKYLTNLAIANSTSVSWHYTVDDSYIINHIPDGEIAWHAGDGTKKIGENGKYLGGGNLNGVGIEMCINKGNDIITTMLKTAMLASSLCILYNLPPDNIKTHSDFANKLCPYTILTNNMWQMFLEMVDASYEYLTLYSDFSIEKSSNGYRIQNDNSGRARIIEVESE